MSAREELFEVLMPPYRAQYAPGEEESRNALLDAYRDEVAHDLAERLRTEAGRYVRHQREGMELAADLIDPKVAWP